MTDIINGSFEALGGLFILLSIRRLHREKMVRGICWPQVALFATWGFWNLWFYPALGCWWSFAGGIIVTLANTYWLGQLVYYSFMEEYERRQETGPAA